MARTKKAAVEATEVQAPAAEPVKKSTRTTKAKVAKKDAETAVEAVDEAVEKPAVKRSRKPAAKKAELTASISVQFGGKSYTNEELVKIAKDVWKYDLKKEEKDLLSVELYVKPEESTVYYVFNGTEDGSFAI